MLKASPYAASHPPLQTPVAGTRLFPVLLPPHYRLEVPTIYLLGLMNLLERLTELRKTLIFNSLVKDMVKDAS